MLRRLILFLLLLPVLLGANNIGLNIVMNPPSSISGGKDSFEAGYAMISAPGYLQLPQKTVNILVPPDAVVAGHSISASNELRFSAPEPSINHGFSDGERVLDASAWRGSYPQSVYLGTKQWGDLRYVSFRILPAYYDFAAGEYVWQRDFQVSVDYDRGNERRNLVPPTFNGAVGFFSNHEDLSKWYRPSDAKNYDYLIVSTPALYAAASSLVAFRQSQGLITSFADIAVILASSPGLNNAAKLRNYLKAQYDGSPFTYLLLIGDHDLVPISQLCPEPGGMETIPSDFYFSDLSSNFDSDNDGRLGEYSTGSMNQDWEMDFTPEIFVGRISTNSATEVTAVAHRVAAFEQNNGAWKNKALLPAAFLNYQGEPELIFLQTDGADFFEYAKQTSLSDMQCTTLYEQIGVVPSHPSDYPLSYDNLRTLLNTESFGILNWSAHGSATSAARKVWVQDENNNFIPDASEMEWMSMVNRQSFDNLANNDGMVIFAASCYNGMIDHSSKSLAEHAMVNKGVAVFGATRTGWYKIGWNSPGWGGLTSYNHHLLENYAEGGMSIGAAYSYANLLHTQYYLFGDPVDSDGIIWPELQNVYTYLLYGDPAIGHHPSQAPMQGEILVWEPYHHLGIRVVNAISSAGRYNIVYSDRLITDYDYISQFEAVFCLFGYGNTAYVLQPGSSEYNLLNGYLNGGGRLYLEGAVNWDPLDDFWGKFATHAPLDWMALVEAIEFENADGQRIWDYADIGFHTQALVPYSASAVQVFNTHNAEYPDACVGVYNSDGNYATLAGSFKLADVLDGANDLSQLISVILDTLRVGSPIIVQNEDFLAPASALNHIIYPNPFRSSTNIAFELKAPSAVRLDIYNLRGQKVRSISDPLIQKGRRQITWDGRDDHSRDLSSGIYLYRLSAGKQRAGGKIVLIK
ncbi:MAG: C25 family cysteine peptidase [Candidatus Cloacimonadaceae bacterium]|nr:C25 family cysteine peptidase [Candidatus Cloacimonadaceae bacterium]MDP3114583.1 C25 family cysteine peptidase [Candidatus Cloacimonadaceae bacterium]